MWFRSSLKTWPGGSQASRAESSLFTFSLVHASALVSLHADVSFSAALAAVHKPAKLLLVSGGLKLCSRFIHSLRLC